MTGNVLCVFRDCHNDTELGSGLEPHTFGEWTFILLFINTTINLKILFIPVSQIAHCMNYLNTNMPYFLDTKSKGFKYILFLQFFLFSDTVVISTGMFIPSFKGIPLFSIFLLVPRVGLVLYKTVLV